MSFVQATAWYGNLKGERMTAPNPPNTCPLRVRLSATSVMSCCQIGIVHGHDRRVKRRKHRRNF
jgi:hypothetical protein